jgi:hypothetical protein
MATYQDVHITVHGQDRIVSGLDIPLILQGQARPLRDTKRDTVAVRCAVVDFIQVSGSDIVILVGMKEVSRMHRSEFMKLAVT